MCKKLIIIGAGGHGKVVANIATLNGYKEIYFLDDDTSKKYIENIKLLEQQKTLIDTKMNMISLLQLEIIKLEKKYQFYY